MGCRIEKCAMLIMRCGRRQITERIELPNPENIRTLGKKQNSKNLVILKAGAFKRVEMKEKFKKNISDERENFSKPNNISGIASKRKTPGHPTTLVRYSKAFLKWMRKELQRID